VRRSIADYGMGHARQLFYSSNVSQSTGRRPAADRHGPQGYAGRPWQCGRNVVGGRRRPCRRDHGTDKAGVASLRFQDQSNLDVGPSSSVKLNKFIYDPNRSGGKAVLDAAKGSFRFTTGAQGGGGTHEIKTPYGTLGIRG
jgi:FecR protein